MTKAKARVECVLDAYWNRCQVAGRQHEAGMIFRTYWYRAHGVQRPTGRYSGLGAAEVDSASRLDAQRRLTVACSVLTPAQQAVVIAVCAMDEWAGGTERLATLRRGLTALADYWQIDRDPPSRLQDGAGSERASGRGNTEVAEAEQSSSAEHK